MAMAFASCEKVIDVDTQDAEKKYVIEAVLADRRGTCKVVLTQTRNLDETNTFAGISGARVTITDNNGLPQVLEETGPGVYEAPALAGIPGHSYRLAVTVGNQVFTATTAMPAPVPIDSLFVTERKFFDETNKYATVVYRDPAGERNAYRFIQYLNGIEEATRFVRDDDANDGNVVQRTLLYFYDDDEEERGVKSGDSLRVDMLSISYPVYQYWYSLSESATGGNQSNTPGNPLTNIQGGALGYFSAHSVQTKTIVVP